MELIKKIKQAEADAKVLAEQASSQALEQDKKNDELQVEVMTKVRQDRKEQIASSVTQAEQKADMEVVKLKEQAENDRCQLREKTAAKKNDAVKKVMDYLKG